MMRKRVLFTRRMYTVKLNLLANPISLSERDTEMKTLLYVYRQQPMRGPHFRGTIFSLDICLAEWVKWEECAFDVSVLLAEKYQGTR